MDYKTILDTANAIKEKLDNFTPKVAIVLGSGFGEVIDSIENKVEISYKDVPNMPVSTVAGHKGSFIFGNIESTKVAVMNGRVHLYEGYSVDQVVLPIRVLKLLGCETIILTNAAGEMCIRDRNLNIPLLFSLIQDHHGHSLNLSFKLPPTHL